MLKQLGGFLLIMSIAGWAAAQTGDQAERRVQQLDQQVRALREEAQSLRRTTSRVENDLHRLQGQIRNSTETGLVLVLFGGFCALWAQNTGRSAWLWFFLGLFFSIITVLVLLAKNAEDRERELP